MTEKKNGFVAMLDILGFSDRVAMDAEVHGLDVYVETVIKVSRPLDIRVILFSDTVVLFTLDDSPKAFDEILKACSQVLYALLEKKIPMRGAIAHGSFRTSEGPTHGAVIAGRPIIEAHHYESQLQWIGVMIAPSVGRHMPELFSLPPIDGRRSEESSIQYFQRMYRQARLQPYPRIPLEARGGQLEPFYGLAVIPTSPDWNDIHHTGMDVTDVLDWLELLKLLSPDPRSQAKYENTKAFLAPIRDTWNTCAPPART